MRAVREARQEAFPIGAPPSGEAAAREGPETTPSAHKKTLLESSVAPSTFRIFQDLNLDFNLDLRLHVLPSLFFGAAVCAIFSLLSAFLEYYVGLDSTAAHFGLFAAGSYMVFSSYFVANHYMLRLSTSYAAIPDDKKFYVLSNTIKSAVLFVYCPLAVKTLYQAVFYNEWSTARIRNLGVLYAIPDAVSMLLVERMAWSTKAHHAIVVIFMVVNLYVTFEEEGVGRALVVYAIFSTFAYLVNLLLATRFLPVAPAVRLLMSALALAVYGGCLAINWTWQVLFVSRIAIERPNFALAVYLLLIMFVVWDDCILLRWLWHNVGKTARGLTKDDCAKRK